MVKLVAYSSSKSGGMMGGCSSTSIVYTGDGRCKVSSSSRFMHNQPLIRETYYSEGLLEKLSALCERYHVMDWTDLPDLNLTVYDEAAVTYCFTFGGGNVVSLGSGKRFPDQAGEMFRELAELIKEARDNAADLEVTQVEENLMNMSLADAMRMMNNQMVESPETKSQSICPAKMARFCSNCGYQFEGEQKFCPECGTARAKAAE